MDVDFEFSQAKLDEYIDVAGLDCIGITNHNLFDKDQFVAISDRVSIPVFPGIEVDLEKGQILVISDGKRLDDFDMRCREISKICERVKDSVGVSDFKRIFDDINSYILIPHYEKRPQIDDKTLSALSSAVTAGEVSSPKKFMYCTKNSERLVPVYFSDCRIRADLPSLPTRQTFLDCGEVSFSAIRECLRDKNKVALSKEHGNRLFQIFEDGQSLSTGLNVVLGDRSSGKSFTLQKIKDRFPEAYHIKQFALVARDDSEDEKRFNSYLSREQGLFSKEYLFGLQQVIEDVLEIDLESDERNVGSYVSSLLEFARETEKHDAFSKAKIYSEDAFPDRSQTGLQALIASTKNLISNVEFKQTIEKHLLRNDLIALYLDLIDIHGRREESRLKMRWVNEVVQSVKSKLQLRSAAPRILDVDLYAVALNKRKIMRFSALAKLARVTRTPLRRQKRGFTVVAEVGPFGGAGELGAVIKRRVSFSDAYDVYEDPYKFLQTLKKIGDPVLPADFAKLFVKIEYRILNKDGFDASGGERSEFFLLDEIEKASEHDMLLIDEPESSFDNNFLKEDVNEMIKEMSKKMPVVVVTHNNTVGASIKPDYLLCTRKELDGGQISWRIYSGHPTSKVLATPDERFVGTWDAMIGSLEAGSAAYEERRQSYENLKN